jgi:pimeloyl-ACP methyl ester carboxylesterase
MRLKIIFAFLLLTATFWLVSLRAADAEDLSQPRFVRNQNSNRVIVFVHGFGGNSRDTWSNDSLYWPEMITKDRDFDGVDVFVYEYPTSITASMTPNQLADQMYEALKANDVLDRRQIIFICHSMGGVITRDLLIKFEDVANNTSFIQFLSTPTDGRSVANLAIILNSTQISKLTTNTEKDYLGDLSRNWSDKNLSKIPSYCAYETRDTYKLRVVSYESATHLCNRPFKPVDADHFGIAKPQGFNLPPYITFKDSYRDVFEHQAVESEQSSNAMVLNRAGATIGSFDFSHNFVAGSSETVLDNRGRVGPAHIVGNWIDATAALPSTETKCRPHPHPHVADVSPQQMEAQNDAVPQINSPHIVMEGNTFINVNKGILGISSGNEVANNDEHYSLEDSFPFTISKGRVIPNYDGTIISSFNLTMDREAECAYLIVAVSGRDILGFRIIQDQRLVGIELVPMGGFRINKVVNPSGSLTLLIRHKPTPAPFRVNASWK